MVKTIVQLSHGELQRQAKEYLQWKGWEVFHHQAGLGTYPGFSDLSAINNGRTIYIEVKAGKDRLSKAQREFKEKVEAQGGVFIEYRTLEDLLLFMKCFEKERSAINANS
jgi:Holliday junction resolvase